MASASSRLPGATLGKPGTHGHHLARYPTGAFVTLLLRWKKIKATHNASGTLPGVRRRGRHHGNLFCKPRCEFVLTWGSLRRAPPRLDSRSHSPTNRSRLAHPDPVAHAALIHELCAQSSFDYGEEIPWLKKTYGQGCVWNTYSIAYLLHLLPLPRRLKDIFLHSLKATVLARLPATLPLGNLYLIASKLR